MNEFLDYLKTTYPEHVLSTELINGEMVVWTDSTHLVALLEILRDNPDTLCKQLTDIAGVDYPAREKRFEVIYQLLSFKHNSRLRVKVAAAENEPVPSIVGVYSCAGWFEREAWDMYGILFAGNPDLRRILTDYGFDGHPQRKDFPLTGYVELRYDETQKRVVYEPVKLQQAYRNFDYLSPWEGPDYVLPGDEKATGTK
jgi:NADH-quinone oxidoreductase subunit C